MAKSICYFVFTAFLLAVFAAPVRAQIKLYLKDGSYQLVKRYQIEGDRVRYYSLERSQWEEVPLSMVDFTATQAAEATQKQQQERILHEAEKTAKDTYQLPANTGYLIAPALRLPQSEGIYAYDGTRLITLIQSNGSVVRDKRRTALNMALPGPILKSRSRVTLPGKEAGVRLLNPNPTFYAQLSGDAGANVQLLRLRVRKDDRVVEGLEVRFKGTPAESRAALSLERKLVAPGIYQIKPTQRLTPGEYALGEVDQEKLNFDVWDFGIDSLEPKAHK